MAKYHVGVDVSKRKHKACIRNLSQDSYSGVFSVDVNRQGFDLDGRRLRSADFRKNLPGNGGEPVSDTWSNQV